MTKNKTKVFALLRFVFGKADESRTELRVRRKEKKKKTKTKKRGWVAAFACNKLGMERR